MAHRNTLIFILLTTTTVIHAMNFNGRQPKNDADVPTEEECSRPPMNKHGHECCVLPKEKIWGDMQKSVRMCLRKFRTTMNDEGPKEDETSMETTTGETELSNRTVSEKPQGMKGWFRTLKQKIIKAFKDLKKTLVIITDWGRHNNDSCFMECVFQDQGFLIGKLVDKNALFMRIDQTLNKNEKWHVVTVAAIEECSQRVFETDPDSPCQSRSDEMFRCVLKYLFFNCPSWVENEYCTSLKKFYDKCPNGPPPEMDHTESDVTPDENDN